MPEMPEVEIVRLHLKPLITNQTINRVIIRQNRLRWLVPKHLEQTLKGKKILRITRLAKYLLFHFEHGTLIIHLGMSGKLYVTSNKAVGKHDHVDFLFENGLLLRYNDQRRFGSILWTDEENPRTHPLLSHLGPEPFSKDLTANYLYQKTRNRKIAIKKFIMDSKNIAGIGNIYANEALFRAGLHPSRSVSKISLAQYQTLVAAIKEVLKAAIKGGGSSIKDYVKGDGEPGSFQQFFLVYGRKGLPCIKCQSLLKEIRIDSRTTVYCPNCQAVR